MRISSIELREIRLPLIHFFETSFGRTTERRIILARVIEAYVATGQPVGSKTLVEKASLQSLARIEDEARTRLGMVAATQQQVQLAREFVRGGTVSAALGDRTAATAMTTRERGREQAREPGRVPAREPARETVR